MKTTSLLRELLVLLQEVQSSSTHTEYVGERQLLWDVSASVPGEILPLLELACESVKRDAARTADDRLTAPPATPPDDRFARPPTGPTTPDQEGD